MVPWWSLVLAAVVAACATGVCCGWAYGRSLRRLQAERAADRREVVFARGRARVGDTAREALAAVTRAMTAGSEAGNPYRDATLTAVRDTFTAAGAPAAEQLGHPDQPEQPERLDPGQDDDLNPPASGGGGGQAETLPVPQYRYAWAHLRGEPLPPRGPWRPPVDNLRTLAVRAVRRMVAVWHPSTPWTRLLDRLRLALFHLIGRYRVAGGHRADGRPSWADIAEVTAARWQAERERATVNARQLISRARRYTRDHWRLAPGWRRLVGRTPAGLPPVFDARITGRRRFGVAP